MVPGMGDQIAGTCTYQVSRQLHPEASWTTQVLETPNKRNRYMTLDVRLFCRPVYDVTETWTYRGQPDCSNRIEWQSAGLPPGITDEDVPTIPSGRVVSRTETAAGFGWFLSFMGTVVNKNAQVDSRGQCADAMRDACAEWPELAGQEEGQRWLRLLDTWERWHLSDMRAGCEHLTPHAGRKVRVDVYTKDRGVDTRIRALRKKLDQLALKAVAFEDPTLLSGVFDENDRRLLRLSEVDMTQSVPAHLAGVDFAAHDAWLDRLFEVRGFMRQEWELDTRPDALRMSCDASMKVAGWTHREVHPFGLLHGRCKVCGVAYGDGWYVEPVPEDELLRLDLLGYGQITREFLDYLRAKAEEQMEKKGVTAE